MLRSKQCKQCLYVNDVSFTHAGNSRVSAQAVDTERDLPMVYENIRFFPQEPCDLEGSFADLLTSLSLQFCVFLTICLFICLFATGIHMFSYWYQVKNAAEDVFLKDDNVLMVQVHFLYDTIRYDTIR